MELRPVPPDGEVARLLLADYLAEIERRLGRPLEPSEYPGAVSEELEPPSGRLLAAFDGGDPVGCGAVRVIAPGIAEVKRMYVAPAARGRGLGRLLLGELERTAVALGCTTVRLDTMAAMTEAAALYRSAGYEPVPDYNGNPLAGVWLERQIVLKN
jgi:GNAT superfamily N-acetyltransferase